MTDYEKIIERLEEQNLNPDTNEAQREANTFRISWLKMLHREKPAVSKAVFLDPIQQRLEHGYSITPTSLLRN